jgi:hypothetical protein
MQVHREHLQPGARIRCPHCRNWHPLFHGHADGTDYTRQMLYFICRGQRFYAGQAGKRAHGSARKD